MVLNMGKIILKVGCMYSSKTSYLIKEVRRYTRINKKILSINYINDSRYSDFDFIVSHNQDKIQCVKVAKLEDIAETIVKESDCIFIDEGQFYPDLKQYAIKWAEQFDKTIVIISLDGDSNRNIFGQTFELIPYCDEIEKFKALCVECEDGTEALFTHRINKSEEQVEIGNSNYIPLCRKCYIKKNNLYIS
jgi:thymidine kinase